jgi:S1-C subfamily serine protease
VVLVAAMLAGCTAGRGPGVARVERRPCSAAGKGAAPDKVTPKLAKAPEVPAAKVPDASAAELADDMVRITQLERLAEELIAAGKTTPSAELKKQLSRPSCRLALVQPASKKMTPAEVYSARAAGVVVVAGIYKCDKCPHWHADPASGFVISASGAVVTSYHVVEGQDDHTLVAMTRDGHVLPVKGVLAADKNDDVAVLQLDSAGQAFQPLALAAGTPVGSPVCVISHPVDQFYTLTCGHVSRYYAWRDKKKSRAVPLMAITADFARGSSGSPVFNECGNVAGVVCSTQSIYYRQTRGRQTDLQMVFKQCVPAEQVLRLITPP